MNRKAYASILAILFLAISFLTGCSSSSTPPTIAIAASAGTPQSAQINQPYATALQATVTANGNPVGAGVSVTFTAPSSGASGVFTTSGGATETDTTNSSGVATSSTFTANGTAGAVAITASTASAATPASFSLTNTAVPTFAFYVTGLETAATGFSGDNNIYSLAGSVAIDVLGDVIGGELDYNDGNGNTSVGEPTTPDTIAPGTAALVVDSNGQGTLTLTDSTTTTVGVAGVITLGVQFVNANHALITQFDGSATSSGSLDLQTVAPIPASAGFAFTLSGTDADYDANVLGGVFATDSTGTTLTGAFDSNDDGTVTLGTLFPSGYVISAPDGYGRGTVTTTAAAVFVPTSIAYYVVGPEALRLIDVDFSDTGVGSAFGQGTTQWAAGSTTALAASVFGFEGNSWGLLSATVGSFAVPATPDGTFTGIGDDDEEGFVVSGAPIAGSYSISNIPAGGTTALNGYSSLTITPGDLGDISSLGIYLTDPTLNINDPNNSSGQASATAAGALVAEMDPDFTATGVLIPQTDTTPGDFTGSASNYTFGAQDYNGLGESGWEFDLVGNGAFASGAFSGYGLVNDVFGAFGTDTPDTAVTFTGTPLADTDESTSGRYTLFSSNTTPNPLVITVVSGTPVNFDVVIYQASGTQAFWLNEDSETLWLGPIEQQGTLSAPAARKGKGAAKQAKTKRK